MQIAKNTFDISPVNTSGVSLVGSVVLFAGLGDEARVDEWCERHAIGECKQLCLPAMCDILYEPTTRGKNTVEILYTARIPLQTPTLARQVASQFSKAISGA